MALILSGDTGPSFVQSAAQPSGSVLQVVSAQLTGEFSTSSTSDTASGLTVSITPSSASNKILILLTSMLRAFGGQGYVYQKLWRGSVGSGTLIHNGYPIVGGQSVSDFRSVGAVTLLDSPATTSAVTYNVSLNSIYANTVFMSSTTTPSIITVMEIKV